MNEVSKLNARAAQAWERLAAAYPDWVQYVDVLDGGDLEAAIPAPAGSNAGHLVIFTNKGKDLWIRFSHSHMAYSIDDDDEMIQIIESLLTEKALFAVTTKGEEWARTTLLRPCDSPELEPGQTVNIVSWTGALDRQQDFPSSIS